MRISSRHRRALLRDVDDQHRVGMRTMAVDIAELHHGEGAKVMGPSRRTFLKGLGLGTGVAIGATVLPMRQLLAPVLRSGQALDDATIAAFAESVELAAVAAYTAAAGSGKVTTAAVGEAAAVFAGHHTEHAAAFGAAAGDKATGSANAALVAELGPVITSAADEAAILEIAYTVENAAAATYLFALGALTSAEALSLTASILPVESQHAVVLGTVLGKPLTDLVPAFQNEDGFVDPAKYPL